MKKWMILAVLLLSALLAAGCGTEAPAAASAAASGMEDGASQAVSSSRLQAVDVQSSAVPLTEQQILDAFDRASSAYGWFDLSAMPAGDQTADVNGNLYQIVDCEGIGTLEELETYLRSLFSEEIVQKLLDPEARTPLYRDIDGVLYELPFHHSADVYKGKRTVSVEETSDACYLVNVTVETLGEDLRTVTGLECDSFPYELVNGRWVFTEFNLVY
jgi:hypothetical protein